MSQTPKTAISIATWNLRALQHAGYTPWPDQAPLTPREYKKKTAFLVERIQSFQADIVGIQEIAQEEAFDSLQAELAESFPHHAIGARGPGSGLRVGVLSRWPVTKIESHETIPPEGQIRLTPEIETLSKSFRRPVLAVELDVEGCPVTIIVVHLKAKRPDYFKNEEPKNDAVEDPVVRSRAMGRSLVVRAAEASGLRALMRQLQLQSKGAVVLLGDFNDGPHSVTTQILGNRPPGTGRSARDEEFYSTLEWHRKNGGGPVHTHVWEGRQEILDHIVVSGDLAQRFEALDCVNDYLPSAGKDPCVSDHGALIARFKAV